MSHIWDAPLNNRKAKMQFSEKIVFLLIWSDLIFADLWLVIVFCLQKADLGLICDLTLAVTFEFGFYFQH